MLYITNLVDIAYEQSVQHFEQQPFTFSSLWSKTWKAATEFKKEKVSDGIGDFYFEITQDPRFVIVSSKNFRLKEFMTHAEYNKIAKSIFHDFDLHEEGHEEHMITLEQDVAENDEEYFSGEPINSSAF